MEKSNKNGLIKDGINIFFGVAILIGCYFITISIINQDKPIGEKDREQVANWLLVTHAEEKNNKELKEFLTKQPKRVDGAIKVCNKEIKAKYKDTLSLSVNDGESKPEFVSYRLVEDTTVNTKPFINCVEKNLKVSI